MRLRKTLDKAGYDAGAATIAEHLARDPAITKVARPQHRNTDPNVAVLDEHGDFGAGHYRVRHDRIDAAGWVRVSTMSRDIRQLCGGRSAMSKAQLVITAVVLEGRSKSDVARDYDVSRQWVHQLNHYGSVEIPRKASTTEAQG